MTDKKSEIIACTIEQDQNNVAQQWAKTFLHNASDDIATQMMRLVCACIASGDFKTRTAFSSVKELQSPSDQLTIADYLSHASRIIIDYRALSEQNKTDLLSYFPDPTFTSSVFARSATHDVHRKDDCVIEGKGLVLGLWGQLPAVLNPTRDFGINIAMGGAGQENFYGKTISANGFSGHVYFHKNNPDELLMVGLEQSAPAASLLDFLKTGKIHSEEQQQHTDQFGQGHSLTGASDVYTAAASLYFSDPVYQAKLLQEKGCFPPDKYGAMHVVLSDETWPTIIEYLNRMQQNTIAASVDLLLKQLLEKPVTAKADPQQYISYIAIDFKTYLERINDAFIKSSLLSHEEQDYFKLMEDELLILIKGLQQGEMNHLINFEPLIKKITEATLIPPAYKIAIERIRYLFQLQLKIDEKLQATHYQLILKAQYDNLQEERNEILQQILEVKMYFQSDFINKDQGILDFITMLEEQGDLLNTLGEERLLGSADDEWVDCCEITQKSVSELEQQLIRTRELLSNPPKLYSEITLNIRLQEVELEKKRLLLEIAAAEQRYQQLQRQGNITQARLARIASIISNIDKMIEQKDDLIKNKYSAAAGEASELIRQLTILVTQYSKNPTDNETEALLDFKKGCITELQKARPELDKHLSFKRIIVNTLLAIALLGVGYLVAAGINRALTGRFTFFNHNEINQLENEINDLVIKNQLDL